MRLASIHPRKSITVKQYEHQNPEKNGVVHDVNGSSLHTSLRHILLLAQLLGQMPLEGVRAANPKSLRFSWKTLKTAFCLISLAGTVFIMSMLLYRMAASGTDLFVMATFVFHACKFGSTLSFFYLAKRWPELMWEWARVEVSMSSYGSPQRFEFKAKLLTSVIILFTLVQYMTNQASNLVISVGCKHQNQGTIQYYYEILTFPYIFTVLDYSAWKAVLLQIVDLQTSLVWGYVDLFIMVMSSALAVRFKQVTERLKVAAENETLADVAWRDIREDYNQLCKLCKKVDECISYLVLMSFGTNLFFILILLFNSLRDMKNNLYKIYFFFSFGFLILRTVYVALYAAWVNDESKKPISILNSVPTSVYNLEIRRFIQQISFDSVALTGRNFFNVTRGLILSVAGAIVTYELVLIQFNENLLKKDNSQKENECTSKI